MFFTAWRRSEWTDEQNFFFQYFVLWALFPSLTAFRLKFNSINAHTPFSIHSSPLEKHQQLIRHPTIDKWKIAYFQIGFHTSNKKIYEWYIFLIRTIRLEIIIIWWRLFLQALSLNVETATRNKKKAVRSVEFTGKFGDIKSPGYGRWWISMKIVSWLVFLCSSFNKTILFSGRWLQRKSMAEVKIVQK